MSLNVGQSEFLKALHTDIAPSSAVQPCFVEAIVKGPKGVIYFAIDQTIMQTKTEQKYAVWSMQARGPARMFRLERLQTMVAEVRHLLPPNGLSLFTQTEQRMGQTHMFFYKVSKPDVRDNSVAAFLHRGLLFDGDTLAVESSPPTCLEFRIPEPAMATEFKRVFLDVILLPFLSKLDINYLTITERITRVNYTFNPAHSNVEYRKARLALQNARRALPLSEDLWKRIFDFVGEKLPEDGLTRSITGRIPRALTDAYDAKAAVEKD